MKEFLDKLQKFMEMIIKKILEILIDRKGIGIRFVYTVLFILILEVIKTIIEIAVICQYLILFITRKHHEPMRAFSNKMAAFNYKVVRYLCLLDNKQPYPFDELPPEIDDMEWPDITILTKDQVMGAQQQKPNAEQPPSDDSQTKGDNPS